MKALFHDRIFCSITYPLHSHFQNWPTILLEDKTSNEKVVSFNGITLETNLYKYELYAGELSRNDIFKLSK